MVSVMEIENTQGEDNSFECLVFIDQVIDNGHRDVKLTEEARPGCIWKLKPLE